MDGNRVRRDQSGHSASRPGVCVYGTRTLMLGRRRAPPTLASFLAFIGDCTHAARLLLRTKLFIGQMSLTAVQTSVSWSNKDACLDIRPILSHEVRLMQVLIKSLSDSSNDNIAVQHIKRIKFV